MGVVLFLIVSSYSGHLIKSLSIFFVLFEIDRFNPRKIIVLRRMNMAGPIPPSGPPSGSWPAEPASEQSSEITTPPPGVTITSFSGSEGAAGAAIITNQPILQAPNIRASTWILAALESARFNGLVIFQNQLADMDLSQFVTDLRLQHHEFFNLSKYFDAFNQEVAEVGARNAPKIQHNNQVKEQRAENKRINDEVIIPHNQAVQDYQNCISNPPPEGCGADPGPPMPLLDEMVGELMELETVPTMDTFMVQINPNEEGKPNTESATPVTFAELSSIASQEVKYFEPDYTDLSENLGEEVNEEVFGIVIEAGRVGMRAVLEQISPQAGQSDVAGSGLGLLNISGELTSLVNRLLGNILDTVRLQEAQKAILGTTFGSSNPEALNAPLTAEAGSLVKDTPSSAEAQEGVAGEEGLPPFAAPKGDSTPTTEGVVAPPPPPNVEAVASVSETSAPLPVEGTAERVLLDFIRDANVSQSALTSSVLQAVAATAVLVSIQALANLKKDIEAGLVTERAVEQAVAQAFADGLLNAIENSDKLVRNAQGIGDALAKQAQLDDAESARLQQGVVLLNQLLLAQLAEVILSQVGAGGEKTPLEIRETFAEVKEARSDLESKLDKLDFEINLGDFRKNQELYTSMERYLQELIQPHRDNVLNLASAFLGKPEGYYDEVHG